jgi:hypothetical protein
MAFQRQAQDILKRRQDPIPHSRNQGKGGQSAMAPAMSTFGVRAPIAAPERFP